MTQTYTRIAAALLNSPWAIQESWLQEMYAILVDKNSGDVLRSMAQARGIPLEDGSEEAEAYDMVNRGVYRRGSTAVIPITGPIFPRANLMTRLCGATSLSMTMKDFKAAENDPEVKNIVIPADSPGGAATLVDEFGSMIAGAKKPVYGHVQGMGASAMYWLLSQMSQVSLSPTSSVGSIGAIMSMTKYRKKSDDEYPKELKFVSSISPKKVLDPESEEGAAEAYAVVNSIAEVFAADVAKGRGVSLETVLEQFGQGGMITGNNAVEVGMADRVDTLEALLDRLDEESSTSYSSYGETQMKRTEYQEKFPEEYAAIRGEGAQEALSTVNPKLTALEKENADLKAAADKANEINAANDARLKALEKDKAVQAEKAIQIKSEGTFNKVFAASGIPSRLEAKVRMTCATPESFTKDDAFDAEGYEASIGAEITGWAKDLNVEVKDPVIQGFGAGGGESNVTDEEAKADATCDSMLAMLGVTK
jgi:ClpP class serine protease